MKVRLDRLGDEPHTWQENLALSPDDLGGSDVLAMSEIACRGMMRRTTPGFLLQVSLSYEQTLSCTRCLGKIVEPVESGFDLLVLVEESRGKAEGLAADHELEAEDLGVLALSGPHLDTGPLVVEHVQLNVPMKSLCREDCSGLCPICGTDLNTGSCDCRPAPDPRWEGLARLKER